MAKLSAYGRTELARYEKNYDGGARVQYAFMSDKHVLMKTVDTWQDRGTDYRTVARSLVERGFKLISGADMTVTVIEQPTKHRQRKNRIAGWR